MNISFEAKGNTREAPKSTCGLPSVGTFFKVKLITFALLNN